MNETKKKLRTLKLFDGNDNKYIVNIPQIHILTDFINDGALKHIEKQTGLKFIKDSWNYTAQPLNTCQITKLFLTYNFKTQYHNNGITHNTILLKFCDDSGFKINNVCYNCLKRNNVVIHKSFKKTDILNIN